MYIRRFCEQLFRGNFQGFVKNLWKMPAKRYSSTLFAVSSGAGKCGVAVIRVSGPKSRHSLEHLCGGITKPRVASLRKLVDPNTREILDKALVLWFPGNFSHLVWAFVSNAIRVYMHVSIVIFHVYLSELQHNPRTDFNMKILLPVSPSCCDKRACVLWWPVELCHW